MTTLCVVEVGVTPEVVEAFVDRGMVVEAIVGCTVALAPITDFLVAGEDLLLGDVITVDGVSGFAFLADTVKATNRWDAIGTSASSIITAGTVLVHSDAVRTMPMRFVTAPAASDNGKIVFLSDTPGKASLTPPVASGNAIVLLGTLQGADGSTLTPLVRFRPQLIVVIS